MRCTKVVHGYYFTSTKMVIIEGNNECGGYVETLGLLYTAGGDVERCGLCGKGFGCYSELKHRMIIVPGNSTPRHISLKTEKEDRSRKNPERMEREAERQKSRKRRKKMFKYEEMDQLIMLVL